MDRGVQEIIRTHQFYDLDTFREVFRGFLKKSVDLIIHLRGIRSGCLENHTGDTRLTVCLSDIGITLLS